LDYTGHDTGHDPPQLGHDPPQLANSRKVKTSSMNCRYFVVGRFGAGRFGAGRFGAGRQQGKLLALTGVMGVIWGGLASLSVAAQPQPPAPVLLAQATAGALLRPNLDVGDARSEVGELQAVLQLLGFYDGPVDGVYGPSTRSAVAIFQQLAGVEATGQVTAATWDLLFPPDPNPVATRNPVSSPATSSPGVTPTPPATPGPTASAFPIPPGPAPASPAPPLEPTPVPPSTVPDPDPMPAATTGSSSAEPDTDGSLPILKKGAKGSAVAQLQIQLQGLGFDTGGSDGVFGDQTEAAVQAFQEEQGLEADGVVGPATWDALLSAGR